MDQSNRFPAGLLLLGAIGQQASVPAFAQSLERPDALRIRGEQVSQLHLLRGDSAFAHYPPKAKSEGLDAVVIVDLLLNAEGQVLEAQVVSESPAGQGFGLAALDTAKTFEFSNPFRRQVLVAWSVEFLP
ncbi:MAG: TonB family protein [Steroidobacteraceae bacterium]